MKRWPLIVIMGGLALVGGETAWALGPVDGEVGALWWANDFDVTAAGMSGSSDAGAPGFRGEVWVFQRYGVRAGIYTSDVDQIGVDESDYASVDVLWRAFSPSENNFVAVGLGWQQVELGTIGLGGDTSGVRLSAEARGSLGIVYLYGQGSYQPSLDDAPATDGAGGRFEDLAAYELEVGVSWQFLPAMSLRAGYRLQNVEFTRTTASPGGVIDGEAESTGFLAGLSARF